MQYPSTSTAQWVIMPANASCYPSTLSIFGLQPICSLCRGDTGRPEDYRRNCTGERLGLLCLAIFVAAYALVVAEERLGPHFRKAVPMIVAAGVIWALCSISYGCVPCTPPAAYAAPRLSHNLLH